MIDIEAYIVLLRGIYGYGIAPDYSWMPRAQSNVRYEGTLGELQREFTVISWGIDDENYDISLLGVVELHAGTIGFQLSLLGPFATLIHESEIGQSNRLSMALTRLGWILLARDDVDTPIDLWPRDPSRSITTLYNALFVTELEPPWWTSR